MITNKQTINSSSGSTWPLFSAFKVIYRDWKRKLVTQVGGVQSDHVREETQKRKRDKLRFSWSHFALERFFVVAVEIS